MRAEEGKDKQYVRKETSTVSTVDALMDEERSAVLPTCPEVEEKEGLARTTTNNSMSL